VEKIVNLALADGREAIVSDEAIDILCAYGIPAAPYRYASSAD
jgi:hypothetical protein